MKSFIKNLDLSVAKEMAFLSIAIGILYATVATSAQAFFELKKQEEKIDLLVSSIISSSKAPISHALWEFHDDIINSLLTGILTHPEISQVKVHDLNSKKQVEKVKSKPINFQSKSIDLEFNKNVIGKLYLQINYDLVRQSVLNTIKLVFFTNLLEALVFTLIILAFVRVRISRPLLSLTRKAIDVMALYSENKGDEEDKENLGNEISFLSNAILKMHNAINKYITDIHKRDKELQELNRMLEIIVEDRTKELNDKNEKLEKTLDKIQKAQKQLVAQEKLASLGSLTSGIAHEINNPLNFIINAALINNKLVKEVMESEVASKAINNDNEAKENLESMIKFNTMIKDHGKRIDHIVKNMLTLSRKGTPHLVKVNFPFFVKEVFDITYKSNKKVHLFELSLVYNMPQELYVHCYQSELTRALVAIFENSHYALMKRFQDNKVQVPRFEVTMIVREYDFDLIIYDNGEGINKEDIEEVFLPFFTTKASGIGTGLGLSTVHEIITELHKGRITIDSLKGEFTRIIITLPIQESISS